jgi:tetratricopeptide (TPR) repeat protein
MAKSAERDAYQRAWAAMQRLLRQGKSFSSHERNCAFLNLGSAGSRQFATISAATGIDFPDDGRGLALCDWDHDGRQDLWSANRTGPRVRLLLNRFGRGENQWLALRLHGDGKTVNRDAVGARIEVMVKGANTPLLRTVYAGSGFLSQSSKWQHFGLGPAEVASLTVRWPGGAVEIFSGAAANGFFDLRQGTGQATRWTPPDKPRALPPATVAGDTTLPDSSRVRLVQPLPVPAAFLPVKPGKKGLLLELWSLTCPNCAEQIKALAPREAAWRKQGVETFAWCLDAPVDEAEKLVRSLGSKVPVGSAQHTPALAAIWNAIQKGLMGQQTDLPVPASFLLDASGRVVAFYKGPATPQDIAEDFKLLERMKSLDRLNAASPDSGGRWFDQISGTGVRGPCVLLIDENMLPETELLLGAALDYYKAAEPEDAAAAGWRDRELADAHRLLGTLCGDRKDFAAAEQHYRDSLALNPGNMVRRELVRLWQAQRDKKFYPQMIEQFGAILAKERDPDVMGKLGVLLLETGRSSEAIPLLQESAALRPDALVLFQLGQALKTAGQPGPAAAAWTRAAAVNSSLMPILNNLAWLRATHPDAALRDGKAAVLYAQKAVELTKGQHPIVLATLAAAQAETGDFDAALATAEKAFQIASAANDPVWPRRLTDWKERFARKEPLREE